MASTLFLYGTLKRGGVSHHLLADQRFLGEAATVARFRLVDLGWYPGMIEVETYGRSICGELWEVDEACLQALDRYEGAEYARRAIGLQDGTAATAYVLREPTQAKLLAGDVWPE